MPTMPVVPVLGMLAPDYRTAQRLSITGAAKPMPEPLRVQVSSQQTTGAIAYPAQSERGIGVTLILGHGAGAGQTSDFIVDFAGGLAARGIDVITFNFLYREQGRRIPDPNDRLEACWRAVIEAVRTRMRSGRDALAIGGKSMGGRIASQVAAGGIGGLAGLVFLGYPLHPPGSPDRLRGAHLPDINAPMLFVQGSRDTFGTPQELRPIVAKLEPSAELYVVEGGDHSFKVRKGAGVSQQDVHGAIQGHVAGWLRALIAVGAPR
jgi:predicted alpha/beta-hydrolase family hydrolase